MSDKKMETEKVAGEFRPGSCYETWSATDAACKQCELALRCREDTKTKELREAQMAQDDDGSLLDDITPLEYFLEDLRRQFVVVEKQADKSIAYVCWRDGVKFAIVVVARNGRLKIQTEDGVKVLEGLDSIEEAEDELQELSG